MSYNIVENGKLKSITSSGMLIEGKPIYGARKQYATNKKMPLAGQASLKYTMDTDGILTGSCHKVGQGYSAWLLMNGKVITTFDNYGGESCSFDFPNVRVKVGDVIELTTNVPTTETTNFFWLNNIGVTPIIGMEPGDEIKVDTSFIAAETKSFNLKATDSVPTLWTCNIEKSGYKPIAVTLEHGYSAVIVTSVENWSDTEIKGYAQLYGPGNIDITAYAHIVYMKK